MRYYVPQVTNRTDVIETDAPIRKGLCQLYGQATRVDVAALGCSWYYDYGATAYNLSDSRYVPMAWAGRPMPTLPTSYAGYLLALNEPDNYGQLNISPTEGASRVIALAATYPQARLIIGGATLYGAEWLRAFVPLLGSYRPAGWHIHGYCEWGLTPDDAMAWFAAARAICPGGELWVTEFADVSGGAMAEALIGRVSAAGWINRYSWFANRIKGAEWFIPAHWTNPALIDGDGLTQFGKAYMEAR